MKKITILIVVLIQSWLSTTAYCETPIINPTPDTELTNTDKFPWAMFLPAIAGGKCSNKFLLKCRSETSCKDVGGHWVSDTGQCIPENKYKIQTLHGKWKFQHKTGKISTDYYYFDASSAREYPINSGEYVLQGYKKPIGKLYPDQPWNKVLVQYKSAKNKFEIRKQQPINTIIVVIFQTKPPKLPMKLL